jgi:sterol desaturase/sphingolipid hydroxylase (fatty acid hydroxylase superfamily)
MQSLLQIIPSLHEFAMNVVRVSAWLLLVSAVFVPLERLFTLRPGKVLRKGLATDLGYYFINGLFTGILLAIPMAVVAWGLRKILPAEYVAAVAALPFWLRLLLTLLVGEIGAYWGHRWCHTVPFLWRFHVIHHSAEQVDFIVHTRVHPVDMVFTRLCGLVPLQVLALASPVDRDGGTLFVVTLLVGTLWGFFIHANLRWRLGPLEQLVASPAYHHWHHTRVDHTDRNFAPMFPFIDRLFGTLHLPRSEWPAEYGAQTRVPATLAGQLLYPVSGRAGPES